MNTELYFTKTHEWAKVDGNIVIVGITDYAQKELGDIVFLEVNVDIGEDVTVTEPFSNIESVKAVSDINSPLSGKVIEINEKVIEKPELINSSPYNDGWIIKIEASDLNLDCLLNELKYKNFLSEHA